MTLNIGKEIAALRRMTPKQLRARYAEVFGEPTRSSNKQQLVKRIGWRLQSEAEGGLSERARHRAEQLARDADVRLTAPKTPPSPTTGTTKTGKLTSTSNNGLPPPGTVLTRSYKGRTLEVAVLENGFEYEGEVYRSLSAVAKGITGSHCSGLAFFGLAKRKEKTTRA